MSGRAFVTGWPLALFLPGHCTSLPWLGAQLLDFKTRDGCSPFPSTPCPEGLNSPPPLAALWVITPYPERCLLLDSTWCLEEKVDCL